MVFIFLPKVFYEFRGNIYLFANGKGNKMSQPRAKEFCKAKNLTLISIETKKEQEFVNRRGKHKFSYLLKQGTHLHNYIRNMFVNLQCMES